MSVEQGVACWIADDGCGRSLRSHSGEEAVSRRMGVEHGVAGCIADDICGRSPCSHASEEA
eukprot:4883365-Prymnesium_polylepis.1